MAAQPTIDDDFDAWFDDEVEPYRFRLLGREWELPRSAPAVLVLRYQKLFEQVFRSDAPDDEPVVDLSWDSIIRDFVPADMYAEWLDLGLDDERRVMVAKRLADRYVLNRSDLPLALSGGPVGKAPAPKQPQDRRPAKKTAKKATSTRGSSSTGSGRTGASSKPGGQRSTAATSPTT